jgi:hypothetical protein
MDCSLASPGKVPFRKGVKKIVCEEDSPPSLPALVAALLKASNITTLVVVTVPQLAAAFVIMEGGQVGGTVFVHTWR